MPKLQRAYLHVPASSRKPPLQVGEADRVVSRPALCRHTPLAGHDGLKRYPTPLTVSIRF